MRVAVFGASPKEERFSNQAVSLLVKKGHEVIPVNPGHRTIEGLSTAASLSELIAGSVDTLTMYAGPAISKRHADEILHLRPRRVIFNPGSENAELEDALLRAGIEVKESCTLVMLETETF